jgi:flagellar biosynthetic protein FliR
MHTELRIGLPMLYGFLLTLARVSGVLVFVPLPGARDIPELSRIVLAFALTILLFPAWPAPAVDRPVLGALAVWLAGELALGILIGLAVAFLLEALQVAAQVIGLQAGYQYASTIDPSSLADVAVLQVALQLLGGMLFFALGLDRQLIYVLARSLTAIPPGQYVPSLAQAGSMAGLGSAMFSTGVRMALPALALLALIDLAFALLGRVHAQLQLLSLAFSLKMLVALWTVAASVLLFPGLLGKAGEHTFTTLLNWLGH